MYKVQKGKEGARVGFTLKGGKKFNKALKDATQDELKELYELKHPFIIRTKKSKKNEQKPPKLEDFTNES